MKTLKPAELKSIEQFFQITQENLLKIMGKYLKSKYDKVYYTKDYIIAVGDIPVALVAHMDTVFTSPPEEIFYDRAKNVMWSPDGLGADDRAGVYSIIQLIKKGYKPTVILTTDEEKGALGASELIKDHPTAPTELKYIIELDRRGSVDCVFYDCENTEFEEYVEKFGFVTAYGTFSDISVICPTWGVAGVNLSIGYVNEHSYSEILYIGNMLSTIEKVEKMLQKASDIETFKYVPASYLKYYRLGKDKKVYECAYDYDYNDDWGWDPSYGISKSLWKSWQTSTAPVEEMNCFRCGSSEYEYNLFAIKNTDGSTVRYCPDCLADSGQVNWCHYCGEPFIVKPEDNIEEQHLCYDCIEREASNGTN